MKERIVLASALLTVLLLSLGLVGLSQAQEPDGPDGASLAVPSAALGTGFAYQGHLTDSGSPADGAYDFEFKLYNDASAGGQVGSTVIVQDVTMSNGLFSVNLDFGDVFNGVALWLQVGVRPGASSGAFTALSPRQALTAVPYALSLRPGTSIVGNVEGDGALNVSNASAVDYSIGVLGFASAFSGYTYGMWGESNSTDGRGMYGHASAASGITYGVYGQSDSTSGKGVYGWASATSGTTYAIIGQSDSISGIGVYGLATATKGYTHGVYGVSASTSGKGLVGHASAVSGTTFGVYGQSDSTNGYGVFGYSAASSGYTYGVYGVSDSSGGTGVYSRASATRGVTYGVYGQSDSTDGTGVYGFATATSGWNYGVWGQSASTYGRGVVGRATATSGWNYGMWGHSASTDGTGVRGVASATSGTTFGVYGASSSPNGYGGYFVGDVYVSGDLSASGSKAFKIDHPLDPTNQYLYHYSVESSEVLDQYSGNATLDENGQAWVELPDWFPAINTDFRYQLTCIGEFAPVYIARKIEGNHFKIAGGPPGLEVSWLITALRNDPYMRQHPQPVEQRKPADELGTYLYPELYGQPGESGLESQRDQGLETSELQGSE